MTARVGRLTALALVAATGAACGEASPSSSGSGESPNPAAVVEGEAYRPQVDPAGFVRVVDNPYMPLIPGSARTYEGVSDGEREVNEITVTDRTKEILGVTATVVHDQVFVDGDLAEDTFDWFAQDRSGNVWYFGEDSRDIEHGKVVSTRGSWEAGVDGAQPGIVMPGDPRVGEAYRQEFSEGEAEDMARVIGLDASVTVPFGSFDGVLTTEDWTPLEPKILERKSYARGIGVVLERLVRGGEEVLRLVEVRQAPTA